MNMLWCSPFFCSSAARHRHSSGVARIGKGSQEAGCGLQNVTQALRKENWTKYWASSNSNPALSCSAGLLAAVTGLARRPIWAVKLQNFGMQTWGISSRFVALHFRVAESKTSGL